MHRRALVSGTIAAISTSSVIDHAKAVINEESRQMVNIIPAPHHVKRSDNGSVVVDNTAWIEAGKGTDRAHRWLREGLQRFAGISVGDQRADGLKITLRIDDVFELIQITKGVRPEGGAAHEEGYAIRVEPDGIEIVGMSDEAVFRAATSLLQMVTQNAEINTGTIMDSPHFAWRGLSFDTVRCFHPVSTVKKVLDLLALYKFNVFHFHLTDSEGWRFQVDSWPQLTEVSGQSARDGRPGGYYTTKEFAEIVEYAADRYIKVVPEFDSPGHSASVITAYPDLASDEIRAMDPAMQYLHPDQEGVQDLIRDVYTDMAEQTNAAYIHVGGDEAIAMDTNTFQRYIQMALPIARNTGKGVVAWQEAARGGLSEGDLVQWWIPDEMVEKMKRARDTGEGLEGRDPNDPVVKAFIELFSTADEDVPAAVDQGANVIISSAKWLYLDTKYTEESADPAQNDQHEKLGMPPNVYANGTVQDSYNWDPVAVNPELSVDRIAGVEAAIWCEYIENESDLFFQLLPRLAGVAEKAWSEHREWDDYRARLALQPTFWDAMGLTWFKSSTVW